MSNIIIKKGQIWQHRINRKQILIFQKKHSHLWKAKVLTDKTNIYAGTHTMTTIALYKDFELIHD